MVADEKYSWMLAEKVYITTTVANECILGGGLAENAGEEALAKGYCHFKEEAQNLKPGYHPKTVNTDGWDPTQMAWKRLRDFCDPLLSPCFLEHQRPMQAREGSLPNRKSGTSTILGLLPVLSARLCPFKRERAECSVTCPD